MGNVKSMRKLFEIRLDTVDCVLLKYDPVQVCRDCGAECFVDEFPLTGGRVNHPCNECRKQAAATYYQQNREKKLEQVNRWKGQHSEQVSTHRRKWRKRNRAKVNESSARYRAQMARVTLEKVDYEAIQARDAFCYLCLEVPEKSSFDHVIPLARGGMHTGRNIAMACLPCNISKRDKLPDDLPPHLRKRVLAKLDELA